MIIKSRRMGREEIERIFSSVSLEVSTSYILLTKVGADPANEDLQICTMTMFTFRIMPMQLYVYCL